MYELDINLLRDRPEFNLCRGGRSSRTIPLFSQGGLFYFSLISGSFLPILVIAGWLLLLAQNAKIEKESAELDTQLNSLGSQAQQVKKLQAETNNVLAQTQALVGVFSQIRPWSAILQSLRSSIPQTVQIETIKQIATSALQPSQPAPNPAGGIEISGIARSFSDVNDFLLILQQSAFFKPTDTKIITAELIDSPISVSGNVSRTARAEVVKPPSVVRYTIQSSLSDVTASALIPELEHNGAIGLVARIRALQRPTENRLPHATTQKAGANSCGNLKLSSPGFSNQHESHKITLRTSGSTVNKSLKKFVTPFKKAHLPEAYPQEFNSRRRGGEVGAVASASPIAKGIPAFVIALVSGSGVLGFMYLFLKRALTRVEQPQQAEVVPMSEKLDLQLGRSEQQQSGSSPAFSAQKNFDMLLIELYQMLNSGNAKLTRFELSEQRAESKADSFLELLDNEVKVRVVNIAFAGTFEQTESILRDIEHLTLLLTVKDYQSTRAPRPPVDASYQVERGTPALINTSFQLQAIMPASSEESALRCSSC